MYRYLLAALALVLAAVLASSPAQATAPGTNGRIVFEGLPLRDNPLWGELFVINADRTGVTKLTHPPNGTEDTNPDWSPEGSRIVFARAPSTGAHSLWRVNPDGTGLRRLTRYCPPGVGIPKCVMPMTAGQPGRRTGSTSPSSASRDRSARRASTVDTAKRIYADGTGLRRLTPPSIRPGDKLDWSPDGSTILFRTHPGEGPNASSGYGANL